MRVVGIIQSLVEDGKRIIVIEHDLAILDVLCDLVHIVYGQRAAYGIFTPQNDSNGDKCLSRRISE